jgi:hypothetical protein
LLFSIFICELFNYNYKELGVSNSIADTGYNIARNFLVGAATGAAVGFGLMGSTFVIPVAVLNGVSLVVSCVTKPVFEKILAVGDLNQVEGLKGIAGRCCHFALSVGAGLLAATALGLTIPSFSVAVTITVSLIGATMLFNYLAKTDISTVINPMMGRSFDASKV